MVPSLITVFTLFLALRGIDGACQIKYSWQFFEWECNLECYDLGWGDGVQPGHAAGEIVDQIQTQCGLSINYNLVFVNCSFPNNRLEGDWFTNEPTVNFTGLFFAGSNLKSIKDGAIATYNGFKQTLKMFSVTDSPLFSVLTEFMVSEATSLVNNSLIWANNGDLERVDSGLITPMANYLIYLYVSESGIKDINSLKNMSGDNQAAKLTKLQTIAYTNFPPDAGIHTFSQDYISAVDSPDMYMAQFFNAGIYMFEDAASLEPLARSSKLAFLNFNDNLLENIPEGLFQPFLSSDTTLNIYLQGNPWRCDDKLQYLQDILADTSDNLFFDIEQVVCATPAHQAGKKVIDVNLRD